MPTYLTHKVISDIGQTSTTIKTSIGRPRPPLIRTLGFRRVPKEGMLKRVEASKDGLWFVSAHRLFYKIALNEISRTDVASGFDDLWTLSARSSKDVKSRSQHTVM